MKKKKKKEFKKKSKLDFKNEITDESLHIPFKQEYTSLIKNQEEDLFEKKKKLIKERLNYLKQKKNKKNN